MKRVRDNLFWWIRLCVVVLIVFGGQQLFAGPLPGAIFTTLEDGSRVNHNIYENRDDVYLDGGPGQNAPSRAAGLPQDDYYFQVTDPSGKVLLSLDSIDCRTFSVNAYGVIDFVYSCICTQKIKGRLVDTDCTHLTGVDIDHSNVGAITVQLMPYDKTPNKGGVYKVWVTPVSRYDLGANNSFHGFIPAWSKTDNYKVRWGKPVDPPIIMVRKFRDSDADGLWDAGESELSWAVEYKDPQDVTNIDFTPFDFIATPPGLYTITEDIPSGWLQTALLIDGDPCAPPLPTAEVIVLGLPKEIHTVDFGNIELGSITACKFDDGNANGINDDEPAVEGFPFNLVGIDVRGDEVNEIASTDEGGCVTFTNLLPGDYTLSEVLPYINWTPITDPSVNIVLNEGSNLTYSFGNIRLGSITACKFYDANANGIDDDGLSVGGVLFVLDGNDVRGEEIYQEACTGEDGCISFDDLLPGEYTLTEVLPADNWVATTPLSVTVILPEGEGPGYKFGNYCQVPGFADFDTKGYWHNKNGITELNQSPNVNFASVLAYVHSLDPYDDPSGYFGKGDEPFDGQDAGGNDVPAGKGVLENENIAAEGSVEAEISNFLIDSVGDGGIREQLAQQLLAFIFNAHYNINDGPGTMIQLPDGVTLVTISDLIDAAVEAWSGVPDPEYTPNEIATLLDWFNNNDSVVFMTISPEPCGFDSMCD